MQLALNKTKLNISEIPSKSHIHLLQLPPFQLFSLPRTAKIQVLLQYLSLWATAELIRRQLVSCAGAGPRTANLIFAGYHAETRRAIWHLWFLKSLKAMQHSRWVSLYKNDH